MPAPLSIIIPTLNAQADLPGCLAALTPGLMTGLIRDVLVIDGGSTDRTILHAHEAGARVICGVRGRGRQLHCGARNARGDWLLCLHADTQLSETWAQCVASHVKQNPEKAAAFQLAYRSDHKNARWLEKRANQRARLLGLPYGDQGLLISKDMLARVGGYPDLPLMEDVALARHLRGRMVALDAVAATSAERYLDEGWVRRGARNLWTLMRYFAGVSPERLARDYGRK